MALSQKRLLAQKMRKKGESIVKIAEKLEVSKSSVSTWCKDIQLNQRQIDALFSRGEDARLRGRLIGAEKNKQKKINAIRDAEEYAKKLVSKISTRELILVGVALYWAEGSKSDLTTGFQFINSDPDMILCIKYVLIILGVKNHDLFCTIQINQIHRHRIKKVLNFWENLLEFTDEQIRKPVFIKTIIKKKYENHDSYYGVCRLSVRKSSVLKYRMLGLIKAFKNGILNADVAQLVRASHS